MDLLREVVAEGGGCARLIASVSFFWLMDTKIIPSIFASAHGYKKY